jgi:hypothetical protein
MGDCLTLNSSGISGVGMGMNSELRSLGFTNTEARLLRGLLRKDLRAQLHVIVTSGLEPKAKTKKLESLYVEFQTLESMLIWTSVDKDAGRAFRQVNVDTVLRLRGLIVEWLPIAAEAASDSAVGEQLIGQGNKALDMLDRSISLTTDTPFVPVGLARTQIRA